MADIPFKTGDVVAQGDSVFWIINKTQFIALETWDGEYVEGYKGIYMKKHKGSLISWDGAVKICTIDEINTAIRKLANDKD